MSTFFYILDLLGPAIKRAGPLVIFCYFLDLLCSDWPLYGRVSCPLVRGYPLTLLFLFYLSLLQLPRKPFLAKIHRGWRPRSAGRGSFYEKLGGSSPLSAAHAEANLTGI